jgi:hypothetical protein
MKSEKADSGFLFAFAVAAASAAVLGNHWHLPWLAEDLGRHLKLVPPSPSDAPSQEEARGNSRVVER